MSWDQWMNIHLKDELKYKTMRSEKGLKRGTNKKSARESRRAIPPMTIRIYIHLSSLLPYIQKENT